QRKLIRARLADGHHVGILERRMGSLVGAVHDRGVCPFEIESIDERLSQPLVLELLPACIEKPSLSCGRCAIRNDVTFDAAVANRRKVVPGRPYARDQLLAKQIAFAREALECDIPIAEIFVSYEVEIVLAAGDRQLGAPPVLYSLIFD